MTPRALNTRHAIDSCTLQLHAWKPFQLTSQTLAHDSPRPHFRHKKPCLSDRSTHPSPCPPDLDLSRLVLLDDPPPPPPPTHLRWAPRKRRRRWSRSVSGRSSDRSGTRRASAAYATCSDFPLAAGGTDSSGELFNGEGSCWGSDASEVRVTKKEGKENGGSLERESSGSVMYQGGGGVSGATETQGNESGYGSEPGYRGDGELGYDDEIDEEEDDGRMLFWGERLGDSDHMDIVGENTFGEQKSHHRCRRKKQQDWRIVGPLR
ncbi:AttH-like protein [Dioscorea alata]|uniref:AttH-like protein n=1 Tax=Dioscorea alata TaxID=55571 RepID=A0ACB7VQ02_DIOAL|nr:AttH-like protein [Dioscorea alata]